MLWLTVKLWKMPQVTRSPIWNYFFYVLTLQRTQSSTVFVSHQKPSKKGDMLQWNWGTKQTSNNENDATESATDVLWAFTFIDTNHADKRLINEKASDWNVIAPILLTRKK